jgi:hypothetical protein
VCFFCAHSHHSDRRPKARHPINHRAEHFPCSAYRDCYPEVRYDPSVRAVEQLMFIAGSGKPCPIPEDAPVTTAHRFLDSLLALVSFAFIMRASYSLGIRSEKLFQRLWLLSGNYADDIRRLKFFFALPEILPEMGQVVEGVRIDPVFHCIGPLLVGYLHIPDRPSQHAPERRDNLTYCRRFSTSAYTL